MGTGRKVVRNLETGTGTGIGKWDKMTFKR